MLFKYNYISDDAEKLQELVNHIVIDIWCNASEPFDINLLDNTNYILANGTVDDIKSKVNRSSANLKQPIEEIYNICLSFTAVQKDYIKKVFERNNNIKAICNNTITPIFYEELTISISEEFSKKVKIFFNSLYEKVFKTKPFFINSHYDSFMASNKRLCPTCGLNTLELDSSNHRDDYDHYLPKDIYPFTAVNLKNLMPICGDCNKKWKKTKNPVYEDQTRYKSFYYYGEVEPDLIITVVIQSLDDCDIDVVLTSETMQDEVARWDYLYSISRRYKENAICHDEVGKGWFRSLKANIDRDPLYDIDNEIYDAKENFLENINFLRAPFLEECKSKKLFYNENSILLDMLNQLTSRQ